MIYPDYTSLYSNTSELDSFVKLTCMRGRRHSRWGRLGGDWAAFFAAFLRRFGSVLEAVTSEN